MTETIAAVIPTRNRPVDLKKAVVSITGQRRLPESLIIVDQSESCESADSIKSLFDDYSSIKLNYVHDSKISGLVEAKMVASQISGHDIVCFLEDDVILEKGYLESIESGFESKQDMLGCSGVITNQPNQSVLYRFMHGIFFRGIFDDPRVQIFGQQNDAVDGDGLILCDVLCGGLSAWRREVLQSIPFDVDNGFFMFEDMEYSTRVVKECGRKLYVNTNARLEHHMAAANRDPHGYRQRRKLKEAVLYFKKRNDWPGAKSGLFFGMLWWLAEAVFRSFKVLKPGPFIGYWRGVFDGLSTKLV